jgi:hypothetical protein
MLAPQPLDPPIVEIRGQNVILDSDLARAYGVTTAILNQGVKRNAARFPADFRFQVTGEEFANLMSQIVTSSSGHGGRRKLPWAYTEHGAIMAATVLNSLQAVEMSVFIVRVFIRLRQFARGHAEITERLDALERRVTGHDDDLREMFDTLRALLAPSPRNTRKIGFAKT